MLAAQGFKTEVMEDTRPVLERLNRQNLYYLLRANGIDVASDIPKTRMLVIAEASGKELIIQRQDGKFSFSKVRAYRDDRDGQIKIERPDCTMEPTAEEKAAADKAAKDAEKAAKKKADDEAAAQKKIDDDAAAAAKKKADEEAAAAAKNAGNQVKL